MPISVDGLPGHINTALQTLATALATEAGADFAGLILYGGAARGRYRAGRSDVNVVVLLHQADPEALARIAPALRAARRAAAVEAMLLRMAEVPAAAFDFPTKFLDIQRHHVVIAGADAFTALRVPRAQVQRHIAQSVRNMLLRLRRRYVGEYDDAAGLAKALRDIARPLALELAALLHDGGHAVPEEDRTAGIYAAAAQACALDGAALAELAALRDTGTVADAARLTQRVLSLLAALADHVDALARATEAPGNGAAA
jgi:hypothetical protein